MTQEESIIWAAIRRAVSIHSALQPKTESLQLETKTKDLFPTKNGRDEHANRFGHVMFTLFDYFNKKYNLHLKTDYKPREEFEKFPDLESIFEYWKNRLD